MSLRLLLRGSNLSAAVSVRRVYLAVPRHSLRCDPQNTHIRQTSSRPLRRPFSKSTINWTSIVFLLAIGATVTSGVGVYKTFTASAKATQDLTDLIQVAGDNNMPVQLPRGRPGTLTPEEEAKLRELWRLTLQVSGVLVPLTQTPNAQEPARSEPSVDATSGSVHSIADGLKDDKHGTATAFKAALAESTPEEIHDAFWNMVKHDHPDALLLRFLRARKWDVNAALVMAISALHWRLAESHVDSDIMPNGEAGMLECSKTQTGQKAKECEDFMSQIRMGKSFLHGRDKEGRPICYVRVRLHKPGQECEESIERFTVYTIETARMFLRPPVDTATVVFDMTDFGMANMDYAPVKFMIKCFEANYPESLGVVLVHNAPWIFNTVWKIIRGWLDPVVASKIHFTNNLKDVQEFIDYNSIIKELGGPVDWSYKYVEPSPNENAAMADVTTKMKLQQERAELAKEYEQTVLDWINMSPSGTAITPAVDADALRKKRDEIAARLRRNYWQLDPYVRARSIYDRLGELKAGDMDDLSEKMNNATLNVPPSNENSGRPSEDSAAQSFHTSRESWEDDVD
ncbi:hypothetical protein, variant [Verruconis gallopava]|uniref:CRAL-TRIO domain-containing protein n=1 Tax=Verruconis gallopava TaxID=253628 RepID=A0A0D1XC87_9PEZI|nr:hypothetical protein, variant [Verruconis gallopava]KIV99890.1 hypothetical protein, variant [Verruconis gallopava]